MEVIWTQTAKDSLLVTLRFIRVNFGSNVAKDIRNEIESQANLLVSHPFMGKEDTVYLISFDCFCTKGSTLKSNPLIYYLHTFRDSVKDTTSS